MMKLINEAIDKVKREEQRKLKKRNIYLIKNWGFKINFPDTLIGATPYILFFLFSYLLYSLSVIGADFDKYIEWADAFNRNDIFRLGGRVLSPMGVPLSQWNFGLGLLFSLGTVFSESLSDGAVFLGWIFTIIFWWAFLGLLYHASRKNILLTFFGASVAFIGTPLGYYSIEHSSESFSFTCLALIAYWLVANKKWRVVDVLLIGVLSGILIIIRLPLAIFLVPVYLMLYYFIFKESKKDNLVKKYLLFSISLIPVLICIVEIGYANRWMTGSIVGSTYNFGSGTFRSFDWGNPEFLLVLLHPLHGLLVYHPLYLFLFIAIIFLVLRIKSIYKKIFFLIILLVFLLNLYLYASWYGWSAGWSFGMRGLGINAVVLIPALIYFLASQKQKKISNKIWFLLISLSCLWSYLLLFGGCTFFYNHKSLLTYQVNQIRHLLSYDFFIPLVCVLFLAKITFKPKGKIKHLVHLPYIITLLALFFIFYFLLDWYMSGYFYLPGYRSTSHLKINMGTFLVLKTIFFILIPLFLNNILFNKKNFFYNKNNKVLRGIKILIAVLFLTVFCSITYTFTTFAIRTENMIEKEIIRNKERDFTYLSKVDIQELWNSYYEYLRLHGFKEKKQALYNYLVQLDKKARIDLNKFMKKYNNKKKQ